MADRNKSAGVDTIVSRSAARSALRDAIRLYVGRGRRYSVKQVSNATGVKDRVIECAMAPIDSPDYREPEIAAALSLAAFLGPEFTSELLVLADQGAFLLPDADDTPPGAVAADTSDDAAVVVRAAIDGKFDAHEKPDLRTVGKRMMTRGAQLAAIGRAA